FRHRVQIPVQAVHDDDFGAFAGAIQTLGGAPHGGGEFTGRELRGVDLLDRKEMVLKELIHGQTELSRAGAKGGDVLIKDKDRGPRTVRGSRDCKLSSHRRFASAGGT